MENFQRISLIVKKRSLRARIRQFCDPAQMQEVNILPL